MNLVPRDFEKPAYCFDHASEPGKVAIKNKKTRQQAEKPYVARACQ
jgi:hypothetical protein